MCRTLKVAAWPGTESRAPAETEVDGDTLGGGRCSRLVVAATSGGASKAYRRAERLTAGGRKCGAEGHGTGPGTDSETLEGTRRFK